MVDSISFGRADSIRHGERQVRDAQQYVGGADRMGGELRFGLFYEAGLSEPAFFLLLVELHI